MADRKRMPIEIQTIDDSFPTTEQLNNRGMLEKVIEVPIEKLHPFKDHPFRMGSEEELTLLAESISENGVVTPAIARKRKDGEYELIAGHRRKSACIKAGLEVMPVLVRELDDDTATIIMVDSNRQRENLLPSEKAFAYKMRLDATKRKAGRVSKKNSVQLEQNLKGTVSRDNLAEEIGESSSQIQRYIRLTKLIPELLKYVDEDKIAMSPAVTISYLSEEHQKILLDAMEEHDCTPSYSQAVKLKAMSKENKLDMQKIYSLMSEPKANQREKITFQYEKIKQYFPRGYTAKQIEDKIITILEEQRKKSQRKKKEPER